MPSYNQDIFNNSLLMKRLQKTQNTLFTHTKEGGVKGNEKEHVTHTQPEKNYSESDHENIGNLMTNKSDNSGNLYSDHIIYSKDPNGFAVNMNKNPETANLLNKDLISNNMDLFKSLISNPNNAGIIYNDDNVKIEVKMKFLEKGCMGIMFSFVSSSKLEDIEFNSIYSESELTVQTSKIKYADGQAPQALVKIFINDSFVNPPQLSFIAHLGMMEVSAVIPAPILITKFIDPYDTSIENYTAMWYEISNTPDEAYHKLDSILVNPMDGKRSIMDFLKKLGGLLNSLNFKVYPPADVNEFHEIEAGAILNYDNEHSIPVLIQASFVPSYTSEFRFSMRAKNPDVSRYSNVTLDIFSIIKFYVNPY